VIAFAANTVVVWPLAFYGAAVLVLVSALLGAGFVLGQRHAQHATGEPYESGNIPTSSARQRLSVKYYLVAMCFLIFDLEVVFLFAWAVVARDVGWIGYAEASVFTAVLSIALAYLWRQGALDWGPHPRRDRTKANNARP